MEKTTNDYNQFIFVVGSGASGLLFNADLKDQYAFTPILKSKIFEKKIIKIKITSCFGIAEDENGNIYHWGEIDTNESKKPLIITIPEKLYFPFEKIKINKLSCGWAHCLFLSDNNKCFGKGKSQNGEIPLKIYEKAFFNNPIEIPIVLNNDDTIVDVFCGFRQSFFVTLSNYIYCSGYNKFGELGFPNFNLKEIYCYYEPIINDFFYKIKTKIKKIETGQKFTCFLDEEGNLFGCGDNKNGQLNKKEKILDKIQIIYNNVYDFSLGWHHTSILTNDRKILICGRGNMGQQGNGELKDTNEFHELVFPNNKENIKMIKNGSEFCFCLTDKSLYAWGWNEHGNLGNNSTKDENKPILVEKIPAHLISQIECGGASVYLF